LVFALNGSRPGTFSSFFDLFGRNIPVREHDVRRMTMDTENTLDRRSSDAALAFGSLIRSRRKAMQMRQDQLALASGVGRRFLIELESGKPSCQLGRSLLVAKALGLDLVDSLASDVASQSTTAPELPDLAEELEEPDGHSAHIL
jgi:DNA-binding XRE family transcriptional regulator